MQPPMPGMQPYGQGKILHSASTLAHTPQLLLKARFRYGTQGSHNLRKFPQTYAVSMGVVLVIMRMHYFAEVYRCLILNYTTPIEIWILVVRARKLTEINCESTDGSMLCKG